jgi:cellobiose phosphorylase
VQSTPTKGAPSGAIQGASLPGQSLAPTVWKLRSGAAFAATTLSSASGLSARISEGGALFSLSHGGTLINQALPWPAEDGFFRLILRWRNNTGESGWIPLVGVGVPHRKSGPRSYEWANVSNEGLKTRVTLTVHAEQAAWAWHIHLHNGSRTRIDADVLMAQDLGLGDEGAVRNSEAFTSQYIDLLPVKDATFGWAILARQNLAMEGGRHPWLSVACTSGAAAYCTDGIQFFGADHRLVCVPKAVRAKNMQRKRLQYESALAGLQSRLARLDPGDSSEVVFVARFLPDHPRASSAADFARLREILPAAWARPKTARRELVLLGAPKADEASSLFFKAPWLHGDRPEERDWTEWFPGERRHIEFEGDGRILAFFNGTSTHVVSRDKEAVIERPHGHILRSGSWHWFDSDQFGTTCYAAGVFSAQAYLGNPTFGRLLPVVRTSLGIGRAAGQRVFLRRNGTWHQLGLPSAYAIAPGEVRWIYRLGTDVIEARVWCSRKLPATFLEIKTKAGGLPVEFLVTHALALDKNEFDHCGSIRFHQAAGWAECSPDSASLVGSRLSQACFAIASSNPDDSVQVSGDGPIFGDGRSRNAPFLTLQSTKTSRMGVILCGSLEGSESLPLLVKAARNEWARGLDPAIPPTSPVRLTLPPASRSRPNEISALNVARLDEVLPWFVHNAAIHFSAPHGLEQQGGAAWGVRDVCQGSVEWLLAAGEWPVVRRTLETVFAQQYATNGSWPQWFMHAPYQTIQQADSHGDVFLWPIKALCDYLEASNDLEFLRWRVGYTDPERFVACGPKETLLRHCDRVVDQCEARFVPGTALINYGDGDWDDTLQPADPAMRTRMISSWTVGLAFHTFRHLACVLGRFGEQRRQARLEALLARMRADFGRLLMPGSIVAGFLITEADGTSRPLLHPSDAVTGIRYRLLPMTRAVLAELFTPKEASQHMSIVHKELLYPDGVRLMSEPARYRGGCESLFRRAESAANVGREISLQYVHAHLRYAEAMAKVGDADRLWTALQVVNPVALGKVVGNALPRQSNVYFSSSDPDFPDRIEAARRWEEVRKGSVGVRGGWRLYSSGPGIFVHKVRACLLGIRESFGGVVFDPVLPRSLDGLIANVMLFGRPVELKFRVRKTSFAPHKVSVNGVKVRGGRREKNPYRKGGLRFDGDMLKGLMSAEANSILIEL